MLKKMVVAVFILSTILMAEPYVDKVLLLSGDGDFVKLPKPVIESNVFTIEAFAYMHAKGGGYYHQNPLFQQRDMATEYNDGKSAIVFCADMQYNETYLAVRDENQLVYRLTCPSPDFGQWNHYAVVVLHDVMYLYINGQLKDIQERADQGSFLESLDYIDIGRSRSKEIDTGFFNGMINEMRIWDHAMSGSQIQELSTINNLEAQVEQTNSIGLAAYWDFNNVKYVMNNQDVLESYVIDKSGNGNDGLMIDKAAIVPYTDQLEDNKIQFSTVPYFNGQSHVITPVYIDLDNQDDINKIRITCDGFAGNAIAKGANFNPEMVDPSNSSVYCWMEGDEMILKVMSSSPIKPKGELAYVAWEIQPQASGLVPITTNKCQINDLDISATFVEGGIYILENDDTNPVTFANLSASYNPDQGVVVEWQTHSETNNLGFNIYSSAFANGPWTRVNSTLIPGAGTSADKKQYNFTDETNSSNNTLYYKVEQMDTDGTSTFYGPVQLSGALATYYSLRRNYPNPFNPTTNIEYTIAKEGNVDVSIYNIQGQLIKNLVNTQQAAGYYNLKWDATDMYGNSVSTGIYFVKMQSGDFTKIHKMTFEK